MNKFGIMMTAAVAALTSFAAESVGEDQAAILEARPDTVYFEFDVASPIQLPIQAHGRNHIKGARWNFFWGDSLDLRGFDFGLVGRSHNAIGAQLNAFNVIDGRFTGFQLGAVGCYDAVQMTGCQVSGLLNWNGGDSKGVQFATVNLNPSFNGVQLGALLNWNDSVSEGFQLGIINADQSSYTGASFGGFNYTDRFVGAQIGVINTAVESGTGLQLGVFNAAQTLTGVQIGLLNMIGVGRLPIMVIANASF